MTSRPVRNERVLAQETDGELVLLHLDRGSYFTINDVGARVWAMCDGTVDVATIVDVLVGEFDAAREVIESDLLPLLEELATDELIFLR